jgi:ABC-type amino acid transport substrate-binding protein
MFEEAPMEKIIPLASAPVKGPLGVAHLPRLWLKCVLAAAGIVPEVYHTGNAGSNKTVIEGLALDPEATLAYLATGPSYMEFEVWVREHAGRLDAASIAAVNAAIDAQQKPADNAAAARAFVGLTDANERGSSLLNALDDWQTVHAELAKRRGTKIAPIVPAVSSQSVGPLGLMHLPRFWMKATLAANDALYESWNSGRKSGFDVWFCDAIGLDLDAALAHVNEEFPTYLAFEAWVAENAANLSASEIAAHNDAMRVRQKPPEVAERECKLIGLEQPPGYRPSIELNDLVDWFTVHGQAFSSNAPQTASKT